MINKRIINIYKIKIIAKALGTPKITNRLLLSLPAEAAVAVAVATGHIIDASISGQTPASRLYSGSILQLKIFRYQKSVRAKTKKTMTKSLTREFSYCKTLNKSGNIMASAMDGGDAGAGAGSGGGNLNLSPLVRTLAKGAAITLGGIFSITMISTTAITLFTQHKKDKIGSSSSISMKKKKKNGSSSCDVCKEKGFYICKLCNGNGTIEWSPLYDPLFINPCLCPTCDGQRIQRCLNCLGSGYIQQPKG